MNKETKIPTLHIARAILALMLLILGVIALAVQETTSVLLQENEFLYAQVADITLEQNRQERLIVSLAEELSVELEGLRSDTTSQLEAAKKNVVATKKELQSAIEDQKEVSLTEVVSAWRSRIAFVRCEFNFLGAHVTQRGAATFFMSGEEPTLITNRHVVERLAGIFEKCNYFFPQDDESISFPKDRIALGVGESVNQPDYAAITLTSPNAYIKKLMKNKDNQICRSVPQIGDEVIVLGFPTIGSNSDVTATEGIIAAIEDDYYVTSAKVDSGNSGGAAIHVENQCYLGIPTFTALGQAESLARILRADQIDI